ncbi:MAG TPA: hypothetical protein VHJ17_16515, partial [Thermomonospora sp.]|nr:hypothetical protein [Thermomonospora sp.]
MTKSPRRLKQQVQDTVGEQVRDLPLHAVRLAMFGVGRALLLSDRVTRDYKDIRENGVGPALGRLRDDAQHTAGKVAGRVATLVRGGQEEEPERAERGGTVATPPRPARPEPRPAEREISVGKPAREPVARPAPEPTAESAPRPAPAPSPKPAAQA